MIKKPSFPEWVPKVSKDTKLLIVGSSGGIGRALIDLLLQGPPCTVGAHRSSSEAIDYSKNKESHRIIDLQYKLSGIKNCKDLVEKFASNAGGIDGLVVLCGGISRNLHWKDLDEQEWRNDIELNLNIPFFLARETFRYMGKNGGRIILTSTESALHGGSPTSFAYGIAKSGIECLVKGLAKEGAGNNILVNGIRPGFIKSGFHERWQNMTENDCNKRIELIPLKRSGQPEEVAALIIYLLSSWSQFITGQMFSITGGDWL